MFQSFMLPLLLVASLLITIWEQEFNKEKQNNLFHNNNSIIIHGYEGEIKMRLKSKNLSWPHKDFSFGSSNWRYLNLFFTIIDLPVWILWCAFRWELFVYTLEQPGKVRERINKDYILINAFSWCKEIININDSVIICEWCKKRKEKRD